MFEAAGVKVSRLIRTRFGDVVLPPALRRGRWEELDSELASALMLQLGLIREAPSGPGMDAIERQPDRQSVGSGKGVSVRVDLGGRPITKTKNTKTKPKHTK